MNKLMKVLFANLMVFTFISTVLAIGNDELTSGACLKYDGSSVIEDGACTQINYLSSSNSAYIRSNSLGVIESNQGLSCTLEPDWDKSIGAAYIINTITGTNGGKATLSNNYSAYYWLNVALYAYSNPTLPSGYSRSALDSNYPNIITKAIEYQTKFSKDISLKLSSDSLNFSKNQNETYSSQKVYITDENNNATTINVTLSDTTNFTLSEGTENGKKYFVVTTKPNVDLNRKVTVKVTVKGSNTYYEGVGYSCSDNQYLVSSVTSKMHADEVTLSIQGDITATKISINLKDPDDNYLGGATFKVENSDNSYSETFTTTNSALEIYGLSYGTYTITQLGTPSTYVRYTDEKTVTLSDSNFQSTVNFVNNKTKIKVANKTKSGSFIVGSKLSIEDESNNVLYNITTVDDYSVIEGIPQGTYYLRQTGVPNGYELNTIPVRFTVDYDTEIVDVNIENNAAVDVPNTLSSRSIMILTISMIVVALGIGILIYAKNSVKE